MSSVRAYWRIIYWDWIREAKRLDTILSMLLFAMITLMIFSFAIDPTSETGVRVRAGVIWLTFLLSGAIGIDRAFRGEGAESVLQGILLAPVSRVALYYAKVTSTFLFVIAMEAVTLLVFCLLYGVDLVSQMAVLRLILIVVLGTAGFVSVGVTLSAMTRTIKGGEVLLRILLFPLMIPVFAATVDATKTALSGDPLLMKQLVLVGAFDLIYLAAGQILFEVILADYDVS